MFCTTLLRDGYEVHRFYDIWLQLHLNMGEAANSKYKNRTLKCAA
jgi:hypothetical protein